MKNNNIDSQLAYEIDIIENSKNKYFFIGFIMGILPFTILLLIISIYNGGISNIPGVFKDTIVIATIVVSIANAMLLKNMAYKKMIEYFNIRHETNYQTYKNTSY